MKKNLALLLKLAFRNNKVSIITGYLLEYPATLFKLNIKVGDYFVLYLTFDAAES